MIAYFNGSFLQKDDIHISPDDRGFLFSDGVYEVVRAYGGKPFRMAEHMDRLARSLRETRIDFPGIADLAIAGAKLIAMNGLTTTDSILYFQITRGVAPRKHTFPDPPVSATVMILISPAPSSVEMREKGVGAIVVPEFRWSRCDIKAIGLMGSVLAVQQAKEKGAEEAIFVRDGIVTEGTHTNVLAVFNGNILTHPLGSFILPGGGAEPGQRDRDHGHEQGNHARRPSGRTARRHRRPRPRDAAPPGGLFGTGAGLNPGPRVSGAGKIDKENPPLSPYCKGG
jgi:D-alanine transaminase